MLAFNAPIFFFKLKIAQPHYMKIFRIVSPKSVNKYGNYEEKFVGVPK